MNTKLIFAAIAIVAIFSFAVTAITTNVSAQNMTEGNMTGAGQISGEAGGPEGTNIHDGCVAACED